MTEADTPRWVCIHVPKTAGTSLRRVLQEELGDRLMIDDADRPLTHPRWSRRLRAVAGGLVRAGRDAPAPVVMGHFLALKYRWCRRTRFALWVRDPVDRVLSRYAHYRRDTVAGDASHAARGLVPGLDLDGFLALPNYRNTLAEYLWGFPLQRLDFIGALEHFEVDLQRFSARLPGQPRLPVRRDNAADAALAPRRDDAAARARVAAANARDVQLYARLMAMREAQVARGE